MCTSCSCSTTDQTTGQDTQSVEITSQPTVGDPANESSYEGSYTVTGMTCGHCVSSVTEEVSGIDGVRDVVVDLASGSLSFKSDEPVSPDAVQAAVREAGYALA
jgi:copper chaperone CopZ